MLTAPVVYPRSADAGFVHSGLATFAYGLPDDSLNYLLDDFQHYDLPYPSFAFDSDLLLLDNHQDTVLCHSEASFSSSLCQSWPDEPFPGQYLLPEMASMQTLGVETATTTGSARSCSPTASDSSTLSDVASYSSDWSLSGQAPGVGPTVGGAVAGPSRSAEPTALAAVPSSVGPIRRGRGRPRKDAPPVVQPPPLCTYIDPLAGTPCNKLLNRHHDLPRHMFKHCQEEAALVISGRLKREDATLLPPDWKGSDEMKLPCRFCNQRFSRADAVKRHEKKEHKSRPRKG